MVAAALVSLMLAASGPVAVAQNKTPDQLREERRQNRELAAENDFEIDVLDADIDSLENAVATLLEAGDSAQQAVEAAKRKYSEAVSEQAGTEARISELEIRIAETEELLRESVLRAYRSFQGPNSEQTALSSDPWQHARSEALHNFANRSTENVLDELRGQSEELEALREEARRAVSEIEAIRNQSLERQDEFDRLLALERRALEDLGTRKDLLLFEAEQYIDTDAALSARITAEVRRLEALRAAALRRTSGVAIPSNAPVELTTVWGFVVNVEIADDLEGLLVAMEREGFTLGGSGYRTTQRQIELRRQHCGTSDYAVYRMPSSQCRPPVARPGSSQHEVGLAVDLTHDGRLIRSRNTAVFRALSRIAPSHGLHNLPSEPWHWSTTGT